MNICLLKIWAAFWFFIQKVVRSSSIRIINLYTFDASIWKLKITEPNEYHRVILHRSFANENKVTVGKSHFYSRSTHILFDVSVVVFHSLSTSNRFLHITVELLYFFISNISQLPYFRMTVSESAKRVSRKMKAKSKWYSKLGWGEATR